MTLLLLWQEYREVHSDDGYSYSQYCARYQRWRGMQKRSMLQVHIAGEKCFVDYAGQTVPIIDLATGVCKPAQIFVAVLGIHLRSCVQHTERGRLDQQSQPSLHFLRWRD